MKLTTLLIADALLGHVLRRLQLCWLRMERNECMAHLAYWEGTQAVGPQRVRAHREELARIQQAMDDLQSRGRPCAH